MKSNSLKSFVLVATVLVGSSVFTMAQTKPAPAPKVAPQKTAPAPKKQTGTPKKATKAAPKKVVKPYTAPNMILLKKGVTNEGIGYEILGTVPKELEGLKPEEVYFKSQFAKQGDYAYLHSKAYLESNDSLLIDTKNPNSQSKGQPSMVQLLPHKYPGDLMDVALLIPKGGNAKVTVPIDTIFSKNPAQRPPYMKAGTNLIYELEVLDFVDEKIMKEEEAKKMKAIQEKEATEMKNYISKNYPQAEELPSGMYIHYKEKGDGTMPKSGQKVKVHYSGFLTNGKKFDSSVDRGQPFEFTIGQGQVIKGWDEGIAKLSKGTKAVLIIPSNMGYGERGAGQDIGPFSTLVFEVELIDFQ